VCGARETESSPRRTPQERTIENWRSKAIRRRRLSPRSPIRCSATTRAAEQDLDAIAWAERAGFRFVVDVETRSGGYSLLVVEPDWVLAQPHILEDIPLKE
jgi:hypothetical protein